MEKTREELRQALSTLGPRGRGKPYLATLKKELHALKGGDPEQLKLQIAGLEQQLATRNRLLFGRKSEKRPHSEGDKEAEKPAQTGHGRRSQPLLPTVEEIHLLDEADKVCSNCGGELKTWEGQHEASVGEHRDARVDGEVRQAAAGQVPRSPAKIWARSRAAR